MGLGVVKSVCDESGSGKGWIMVRKLERKEFDMVFRIMEDSFPEDEYRTYQEQKKLLDESSYGIYVLPGSAGAAIEAFMAVWEFEAFVFIEHFAVSPAHRNHGMGGRFLEEFLAGISKMAFLEVEPPHCETASGRIGFYKRNRFFLNEYPYVQPAISKGRNPVPLMLMTYGRPVDGKEFEEIKRVLFSRVYKQPVSS